jgi:hypothetical protein
MTPASRDSERLDEGPGGSRAGSTTAAMQWNPPPEWPEEAPGWIPSLGWEPDPSWPAPPYGWPLWVPKQAVQNVLNEGAPRHTINYSKPPGDNWRWNNPPGWPEHPPGLTHWDKGWSPRPSWKPAPAWPLAPDGWAFWVPKEGAQGHVVTSIDRDAEPPNVAHPFMAIENEKRLWIGIVVAVLVLVAIFVGIAKSGGGGALPGGTDSCAGNSCAGGPTSPATRATTNPTLAYNQGQHAGSDYSNSNPGIDPSMTQHFCQEGAQRYLSQGDGTAYNSYLQGCLNG